ncbi:MAG: ribosome silencing factor [Candidatus Anaerobiospirillum merdipullorum]|uniref:Ribosomal silencing factor RsfS n=1 Tax=Candidatus Anaerobiospirillum merdipullorum TaxID=2838450 RepID=A0A9E2KM92_9GAMM|nr:ribosome silencing factor [Candidatus Anaerobiospirillum merdipullorum]
MVQLPASLNDSHRLAAACRQCLEALKAENIVEIDMHGHTILTDIMLICSGTSTRHVSAIAERMLEALTKVGLKGAQISGEREGQWVLVDLGGVMVHVLLPEMRERYALENLYRCMATGVDESAA